MANSCKASSYVKFCTGMSTSFLFLTQVGKSDVDGLDLETGFARAFERYERPEICDWIEINPKSRKRNEFWPNQCGDMKTMSSEEVEFVVRKQRELLAKTATDAAAAGRQYNDVVMYLSPCASDSEL